MEEIKKLYIQKVTDFKVDTILLGGMGDKKNFKYFTIKLFNKNINKILHVQENYLVSQLLLCSTVMQTIGRFSIGPVMFVVTCLNLFQMPR